MNYGFVINNKTCIGCHACSVACKSENEVPLGVNRTWVKYVEKGKFPNTTRNFQVTRCNHCANPPCVRICPVTAMYQRSDGIVEFDPEVCIGCKACMQACPYDAIYIDPDTHSAAKCHYCSHRTDLGLRPACVVVCPTESIIAGDLDDPQSYISRLIAREHVSVRKPEQGTAPKLFYVEGDDVALTPTASQASFMWADLVSEQHVSAWGEDHSNGGHSQETVALRTASSGTPIRTPTAQGTGYRGPIHIGEGRMAEHMIQTAYNAQHLIPWHWQVPAYLVTKGIGAGLFMMIALPQALGLFELGSVLNVVAGFVSLLFILITTGLLVYDLEHPKRFMYIILRPQLKSWLTIGAFILMGFSAVGGLWWLIEAGVLTGILPATLKFGIQLPLLWLGLILAVGAAIYTAFLFGQAEGRDLWQSPLLPFHLLVQALMVGSGTLLILSLFLAPTAEFASFARITFIVVLIIDLFVTLIGEFSMPHASEVAVQAAHQISGGRYRNHFWGGSLALGHVLPIILILIANPVTAALAGLATIIGLYLFEYAFVLAPQEIPNS